MITRKRMNLFRYNMAVKTQMGRNPDALLDAFKMQTTHKSLNLLDFERNGESDLFLLDVNSDRSEFGGSTGT